MADFIFKLSPNILLGSYISSRAGQFVSEFGDKFMIVADPVVKDAGFLQKLTEPLESKGFKAFVFDEIPPAATSQAAEQALELARGARIDCIIALGGVKTFAAAKNAALLYNESAPVMDFIDGKPITKKPAPLIAVPTTCINPFLFTEYSPIIDARNRQTALLKSSESVCKGVIFDPQYFSGVTKNTALTMMFETLGLAVEAYISTKSSFFSDAVLENSIELIYKAIDAVLKPPSGLDFSLLAEEAGCLAAIGAAASSPGITTSIALSINARYKTPRALVASIMLPYALDNVAGTRLEKMEKIASLIGVQKENGSSAENAAAVSEQIRTCLALANIPARLKDVDLTIEQLVPATENAGSLEMMNYIPRAFSSDELFDLVKQAY